VGDLKEPRMNADRHGLLLESETQQIIGCAMEVLNILGHGLLEKPYENALVVEFGIRGVSYQQQPNFDVVYKDVKIGDSSLI
jgi:GxxExxY protein